MDAIQRTGAQAVSDMACASLHIRAMNTCSCVYVLLQPTGSGKSRCTVPPSAPPAQSTTVGRPAASAPGSSHSAPASQPATLRCCLSACCPALLLSLPPPPIGPSRLRLPVRERGLCAAPGEAGYQLHWATGQRHPGPWGQGGACCLPGAPAGSASQQFQLQCQSAAPASSAGQQLALPASGAAGSNSHHTTRPGRALQAAGNAGQLHARAPVHSAHGATGCAARTGAVCNTALSARSSPRPPLQVTSKAIAKEAHLNIIPGWVGTIEDDQQALQVGCCSRHSCTAVSHVHVMHRGWPAGAASGLLQPPARSCAITPSRHDHVHTPLHAGPARQ